MHKRNTQRNNKSKSAGKTNKRDVKWEEKEEKGRKKGAPKWKRVVAEIEQLEKRIPEETPPSGALYYKYKQEPEAQEDSKAQEESGLTKSQAANRQILETSDKSKIKIRFSDLPISKSTVSGLFKGKFIKMTETQRSSISHSLAGRDMVVCARTGSGKTLAYLIPIVEKLFKERWSSDDGLGALVLVPTRELGIQAYEVLRSFGGYHDLSAGLVIGGKDVEKEKEIISTMNILICTPGRLLQHMDETHLFNGDNLKCLVIDEVDRLMDMGFKQTIDQIMVNLPKKVQTLLFSATIGRKVKDLACVNLKPDHEYICIHDFDSVESKLNEIDPDASPEDRALAEKIKSITPVKLLHHYMELKIEDKLDVLFSFLKAHPKSKCLVFFSARKQVRFAYQSFKGLKLGQNLFELHGKQAQNKRTAMYFQFVEKKSAVLFATDIAARGIDFPAVDWVIQFDAPEDLNTYIHRVGRTARYKAKGSALLFLLPSEKKFIERLQAKDIGLTRRTAAPNRQLTIQPTLQKMNAENPSLMHLAKRACVSYLKCIHLMKDKEVFKLKEIDTEKLAESLGLATVPEINFGGQEGELQVHSTMSRAEHRAARIKVLRERKDQARKRRQQQTQEEVWAGVSDGESLDPDESDDVKEDKPDLREGERPDSSQVAQNDSNEDDDDDSYMVKVAKGKKQPDAESDAEEDEAVNQQPLKVTKKQLRKILPDGHFGGKNRQLLGQDGQVLTGLEAMKVNLGLGSSFQVETEEVANETLRKELAQKGGRAGYMDKVKERLQKTKKIDDEAHRARITELRHKKKRQKKERDGEPVDQDQAGDDDQDVPAGGAKLQAASGSDSDLSQSSRQSDGNQEPESDYASADDQVSEPATKRQKVNHRKASGKQSNKTAEQRALELLDCDF